MSMKVKRQVLEMVSRVGFEETLEQRRNCPKCVKNGKKDTVLRRITAESQEKLIGTWFVEHCEEEDCDYWDCGFVGKD